MNNVDIIKEFGSIANTVFLLLLFNQIILFLGMVHASFAGNKRYLRSSLSINLYLAAANGILWFVFREVSTAFAGGFFVCLLQWATFQWALFKLKELDKQESEEQEMRNLAWEYMKRNP